MYDACHTLQCIDICVWVSSYLKLYHFVFSLVSNVYLCECVHISLLGIATYGLISMCCKCLCVFNVQARAKQPKSKAKIIPKKKTHTQAHSNNNVQVRSVDKKKETTNDEQKRMKRKKSKENKVQHLL